MVESLKDFGKQHGQHYDWVHMFTDGCGNQVQLCASFRVGLCVVACVVCSNDIHVFFFS